MPTFDAKRTGYHAFQADYIRLFGTVTYKEDTEFTYTFENFFHPFIAELIEKLNRDSLNGMFDPGYHQNLAEEFFDDFYTALEDRTVKIRHFPKEIDLRDGGPYANYNWELLFHIPLTIAVHLSKNQRFAEAQHWFHYIFDPTCNDTTVPAPQRYWKFLAFRSPDRQMRIDELLTLLSKPDPTPEEAQLQAAIVRGYEAIRSKPFQPHAVARTRRIAYQYSVVWKYIENLIAWGDSLFRQDTAEAINEATQRYVLASNLLGPKPQRIPPGGASRPRTFAELRKQGLDAMGNALVELESKFPFNLVLPPAREADPDAAGPLFGIGRTLYFCIPPNDKLLGLWDTVADRLYKIRHCMNIEGFVRPLALFEPPIDPGLLVKAAAAGIDIGSIAGGTNQPAGPVRSVLLIQKALELCAEVRAFGSALLAAIEKQDGERLALLRQEHELGILQMSRDVRFLQWKQAEEATEGLLRSRAIVLERYRYYRRLLGLASDGAEGEGAPDTFPLDRRELTEDNFDEAFAAFVGQYDPAVAFPEYAPFAAKQEGRLYLHAGEYDDLNEHADRALAARLSAASTDAAAGLLVLIPTFYLKASYWGIGPDARVGGGGPLASAGRAVSAGFGMWAAIEEKQGQSAAKKASYERRADEWMLQARLAARELMQLGRQIIGSLIAEQAAYREYAAVGRQIGQAEEVDRFLREKFSGEELYAWMQGELSRLYYEYYRFAFDTARKAEQTMKRELMRPEIEEHEYVKPQYWNGGRRGLLAGEALHLDLKRMEMAYHEYNKREYELTKHVSLRQLDPLALLSLKATGSCETTVPEWLFDLDCPGHYMRRIKSVSLSVPSVTGPYTSVNCTLTLLGSTLRKSPQATGGYAREGSEDARFVDYVGAVQSIVTSSGSNDSGLFESNLRDDRFLPFEGAGAASSWRIELPAAFRQFDYASIADVILHIRYTARDGGAALRRQAVAHLEEVVAEHAASGLSLLLGLPHEFPAEWHRFVTGEAEFEAVVKRDWFPYMTRGRDITVERVRLHAIQGDALRSADVPGIDPAALSDRLNGEGEFTLTLAPDGNVLVRDLQANVFVRIEYALK